MQEQASLISPVENIVYDKVSYILKRPTIGTRKAYSRYLEQNAIEFVQRNRVTLAGDFAAALAAVCRRGGSNSYGWKGEIFAESLRDDECFQELAYLILAQENPRFDRGIIEKLWDAPGGLIVNEATGEGKEATLGEELVQKIVRLINSPNSIGQAPKPAGN